MRPAAPNHFAFLSLNYWRTVSDFREIFRVHKINTKRLILKTVMKENLDEIAIMWGDEEGASICLTCKTARH